MYFKKVKMHHFFNVKRSCGQTARKFLITLSDLSRQEPIMFLTVKNPRGVLQFGKLTPLHLWRHIAFCTYLWPKRELRWLFS